jgi:hypothetical protein
VVPGFFVYTLTTPDCGSVAWTSGYTEPGWYRPFTRLMIRSVGGWLSSTRKLAEESVWTVPSGRSASRYAA